jgi:hypothetical protein
VSAGEPAPPDEVAGCCGSHSWVGCPPAGELVLAIERRWRHLHLGPDELLVGAKVEFDPALSLAEAAEAIDEAERRVRAIVPTKHQRGHSISVG